MLKSILKPESGVAVGVITSIGVYEIYNSAMPSATSVRNAQPHDTDVEGTRKNAAIHAAILVVGVFLLTRDLNAFIISGGSAVAMDYMYKHNNGIDPGTGKLDTSSKGASIAPGTATALQPLPDYSDNGDDGTTYN